MTFRFTVQTKFFNQYFVFFVQNSPNFLDQWLNLNKIYFQTKIIHLQFFNMFKYRCHLVKRMKIIKKSIEESFRKLLLKIDNFHRVKKGT